MADAAEKATPTSSKRAGGTAESAVCIILAAGFSKVEQELEEATDGPLRSLAGTPKALLPVAGKPMLDHWWEYLSQYRKVSDVFIVSNAIKYKQFERWATAKGIAVNRVVNTGATTSCRSRGVLRDVELGMRRAQQVLGSCHDRDMIILAGDTLFFKDFDMGRILDFHSSKGGSLLLYYARKGQTAPSERGMCEVDSCTSQVTSFAERPDSVHPGHSYPFVVPLFYILEPSAWQQIPTFNQSLISSASGNHSRGVMDGSLFKFGYFIEHAVGSLKLPFYGMRMPGAFFLIGTSSSYEDYRQLDLSFQRNLAGEADGGTKSIRTRTYARVGVMGNPSDGFNGKTIAMTIQNFWASVELWESEQLRLVPHPLYDPNSFSCLADLHFIGRREGYYGGTRLLMASCKRFQEMCTEKGIALPRKNFTVKYDTNIPRQVGLAGSSAIVNSLFQALMKFYNLTTEHVPLDLQPSFILSVEAELGIQAGLQDRVVQVYEGLVFMDFDRSYMKDHGHGRYERIPREIFEWVQSLPFFIAYESDPSDSGKIHSNVKRRWEEKDNEVVEAMRHFAELTVQAKEALETRNHAALADLMDENFNTRRRLYGDACLGRKNLQMIEICRSCGAAAKFPGSGGAVLGLCRAASTEGASASGVDGLSAMSPMDRVREALEAEHFVFCPLDPVMPERESEA